MSKQVNVGVIIYVHVCPRLTWNSLTDCYIML